VRRAVARRAARRAGLARRSDAAGDGSDDDRRPHLRDQVLASHGRAARRDQRADRREDRVPSQRRVRGRSVDSQRRLHVVGGDVLLTIGPWTVERKSMNLSRAATMIAAALVCVAGGDRRAAAQGKARAVAHPPTATEFAALKQQVERQNELIIKLTQLEAAHYEYLVKLLQNPRSGSAPITLPAPAPPPSSPSSSPLPPSEPEA